MPLRRSQRVWAGQLVPKMEAICGGGLIFPREGRPAQVQGNRSEAAEEIRTLDLLHGQLGPSPRPAGRKYATLQAFRSDAADGRNQGYVRIMSIRFAQAAALRVISA
jgi:hypothetical protein